MYKQSNSKFFACMLIFVMAFLLVGVYPAEANTGKVTLNGTELSAIVISKARMVSGQALAEILSPATAQVGADSMEIKSGDKVVYFVSGSRVVFLTTGIGTKSPSVTTVAISAPPRTIGRGGERQVFVPFNDVVRLLGGSMTSATSATLVTGAPATPFDFSTDKRDAGTGATNNKMIGRGATFANTLQGLVTGPVGERVQTPAHVGAWVQSYKNASKDLSASKMVSADGTAPFDVGYNSYNMDGSVISVPPYGGSATGSGAGINAVRARLAHFGGTDSVGTISVADRNDYAIIPIAMGGVAVMYKLPNVSELRLTPQVIADIYMGKISKWNDRRIASLNPKAALGDWDIEVVYRADSSGTTEIFTAYLSSAHKEWRDAHGVNFEMGKICGAPGNTIPETRRKPIPGGSAIIGYMANPDSGKYPIGYASMGDIGASAVSIASLRNRAGNFVKPYSANVYAAGITHNNMLAHPVNASGAGAYPITGFTWMMIEKDASKAKGDFTVGTHTIQRPALTGTALTAHKNSIKVVKDFVRWAVVEGFGDSWALQNNYAPVTPNIKLRVEKMLDSIQ